jgi:hypothetical protein
MSVLLMLEHLLLAFDDINMYSSFSVALQSEVDLGRLLDMSPSVPVLGCHPPIPTS